MTKRRFVSLLPQHNQTTDLRNLFAATVDHVFQPGQSEQIAGYIGHGSSSDTEFYLKEPSASRSFYQLEPGMISGDPDVSGSLNYALTYPDLVSYFSVRGANVSDHERLLDSDYYSWAPPINIDMIANFSQYYWFGESSTSRRASYSFNPYDRSPTISLSNNNLNVGSTEGEVITPAVGATKLGAYVGYPDMYNAEVQAATTARWDFITSGMGRAPTMALQYVDKEHPRSQWLSDQDWVVGSWKASPWLENVTPVIGLPMAITKSSAIADFQAISAGQWNGTINGIFKSWADAGYTKLYLRPGWEMNGDWYAWGVTNANAVDFAAAFKHIATLAHSYPGMEITVVWNPNVGDPTSEQVPFENYYPGDDYVDIIGIDTYGDPIDSDSSPDDDPTTDSDYTLRAAIDFAKARGKPFAIPETGGAGPAFASNLANEIAAEDVTLDFVGIWTLNDDYGWSNSSGDAAVWRAAFEKMYAASTGALPPSGTVTIQPSRVASTQIGRGAWYVEIFIRNHASGQAVGLLNSTDSIVAPNFANGVVSYASDGTVSPSGSQLPSYTAGDVIGIAWDTSTRRVWFRKNNGLWNNTSANPAGGGYDISALLASKAIKVFWSATENGSEIIANFGDTGFSYTPPAGFISPASSIPSNELPTLVLDVPTVSYTGNGSQTSFALPRTILAVATDDEVPTAYVDNIPVAATKSGDNLVLAVAPPNGSSVLLCRTPDLATVIIGQTNADIFDLNLENVRKLTSTMRIRINDAAHLTDAWDSRAWDTSNWDAIDDSVYMVDGVGTSLRLTPFSRLITVRNPQHVTIERSSLDHNAWSLRNLWVHRDAFAWSNKQFTAQRATRPIIEFVRDIVLYPGQEWKDAADPLFMLYDLAGHPLNDVGIYPSSTFAGNRIFGFAKGSGSLDPVTQRILAYNDNGYVVFKNDVSSATYSYLVGSVSTVVTPITGMLCYATGDSDPVHHPFWHAAADSTSQPRTNGFYHVPLNLSANPDYDEVDLISRANWVSHFAEIIEHQDEVSGSPSGANNYRDTARDLSLGRSIIQHRAPLLKTMLLAAATDFDLLRAIRFSEREYARFRNKFARKLVEMLNRGVLLSTDDPELWVEKTLNALQVGHTNNFAFALSTMAGGQYFIPATPTALGVLCATVPTIITDSSGETPVEMIVGHDGSMRPTTGDWRDAVFLALETQIYAHLPDTLKTDKRPAFDLQQWIGGYFYAPTKGYSRSEFAAIIAPFFANWAQFNRLDYRTHDLYDAGDPFTWNYRGIEDRSGNPLPGHWRGIYKLYYDTDAPSTRPWEMLGFIGQPDWWEDTYGVAPYTSSNTALWTDLEAGTIADGDRQGTDERYARPGLSSLLPVDHAGNLLNPLQIGIVTQSVPFEAGSRGWIAGDNGPAETLWWNSPSSRFAQASAAFLMKPARLVEQCWDALRIGQVSGQWVTLTTAVRPRNASQYVHGEADASGAIVRVTGISQWISDYLISRGKQSTEFGSAIRGLGVRLLHQIAGFVSNPGRTLPASDSTGHGLDVQIVADSIGLLPAENVRLALYASPPERSEVYSGVIVEWTGRSWRVIGYDERNPAFMIIPPNLQSNKGIISLAAADEPNIVLWRSNTYYPNGILVSSYNSVYECQRGHTSGANFEERYWRGRPDMSTAMVRAPRVATYERGLDQVLQVPYGTEFFSFQEIADFLLGWERWLESRGWIFDGVDQYTGNLINWSLAVKEFLSWSQVQWSPGNFIALSPGQQKLGFTTTLGNILDVEDPTTGFYGLINRSGSPISQRDAMVDREDGSIALSANENDIFLARLEINHIEHLLVLDNTTIFDDEIYVPVFNMRQQRLRLSCQRATGWAGRLDAPGFIVAGNRILANFTKTANDVRLMFDIEQADNHAFRDYARHVVGMQERSYLDNLLLSHTEQFEFYQGMIQQKGTRGVFDKLIRSRRVTNNSTLRFLEEWAFRTSTFGAPLEPFITMQLTFTDVRDDPQMIHLTPRSAAPVSWIVLQPDDARWVDKPKNLPFFPSQRPLVPARLPTAGPVRLDEVSYTAFAFADVPTLYDFSNTLPTATRIWVYEDSRGSTGRNWYVDATLGNDNYSGLSETSAFASLQHAHDRSEPGDVINISEGIYVGAGGAPALTVSQSGLPFAPITYRGNAGSRVVIMSSHAPAAVQLASVSYVRIENLVLEGWSSALVISDAQALPASETSSNPVYAGHGLSLSQSHFIKITDCEVYEFPGSGIDVVASDHVTIERCKIYSNAKFSSAGCSGIRLLRPQSPPNQQSVGAGGEYRNFIRQNVCFDNCNLIVSATSGNLSDGHGIALLDGLNASGDGIAYSGRTLIENNLCYNNGGSGILVDTTAHVDVVFNTAYRNQTNISGGFGDIAAHASSDASICNNIAVSSDSKPVMTDIGNIGVKYFNNIASGGSTGALPGISNRTDPLFRNAAGSVPDFSLRFGSQAINAANRRFVTTTDLFGNARSEETGFDIGCLQHNASDPNIIGQHPYNVLQAFEIGELPCPILRIVTPAEDASLDGTRIIFQFPHSLGLGDVGNYLIVDGITLSNPDLQGLHVITAVHKDLGAVDISTLGVAGHSYQSTASTAPFVRILRSIRFATREAIAPLGFATDDLVWVDDTGDGTWAVLRWSGTDWVEYRRQPTRIDTSAIGEKIIYDAGATIAGSQLILNQPLVNELLVIDPLAGLIAGSSDSEIDFKTDYDPARYNSGTDAADANLWGSNEVGRVWWNLGTVKFMDIYTDVLGRDETRDIIELKYRLDYCGKVAPNSSVDVYEWIESTIEPSAYAADSTKEGEVYNSDSPSWVTRTVYGGVTDVPTTRYYFWVKNRNTVPNLAFRNTSVANAALGISSPSSIDLPWMAPVAPDALIISGVAPFLNETRSVLKIRLRGQAEDIGRHAEWMLMRPLDSTSLPTDEFWEKMRDGLAAFRLNNRSLVETLPDMSLPIGRRVGIDHGQNMFMIGVSNAEPWQADHVYYFGDLVSLDGNAYQCTISGTTDPHGVGPSGTGSSIEDGSVTWRFQDRDPARAGLLAARASFVASVNRIFAASPFAVERSVQTQLLYYSTPLFHTPDHETTGKVPELAWSQINKTYPIEQPPSIEWSDGFAVYTLQERNYLLARAEFHAAMLAKTNISVLLNGISRTTPQWSIWEFQGAIAADLVANNPGRAFVDLMMEKADIVYRLKPVYDHSVAHLADASNRPLVHHDRVLVTSDADEGFWAIYRWNKPTSQSVGTFDLWRVQTFKTDAFIDRVDWYADGYGVNVPPVITYASIAARNAAEGDDPINRFVKVLNDGSSRFIWTVFSDGIWKTVAIEDGTVELNELFFESDRVPHGINSLSVDSIRIRDGSWELRVIAHILRYSGLLSDTEINEIWFDIINFIHVQQNEVDWAFKTSFMVMNGINVPLLRSPSLLADQSDDLVSYVSEVKPYHVKIRESATQYSPEIDDIDVAIEETSQFDMDMLFDRVVGVVGNWDMDNWDIEVWDASESNTGAAYRILVHYEPTAGMPARDLRKLLDLETRVNTITGFFLSTYGLVDDAGAFTTTAYDLEINPSQVSRPGGFDFRAPYYLDQHPEERVAFNADDGLRIQVDANPLAGGPTQNVRDFDVSSVVGTTVNLFLETMPQSIDAVMVFFDGVRGVRGTDYEVDCFARSMTANLTVNGNRAQRIAVHVFGFGGTSAIAEQHFLTYGTHDLTLTNATTANHLLVTVNGERLTSGFSVNGTAVTITSAPSSGSDVALLAFADSATDAAEMFNEVLEYDLSQEWTLAHPDTITKPEHAGTIVTVDGLRLTPPTTFYGHMTTAQPYVYLPLMPVGSTTVTVYCNGTLYAHSIPICTTTNPSSVYPFDLVCASPPPTNIAGQFVLFDNKLVSLDTNFTAFDIAISMKFVGSPPDYEVNDGLLTINSTLTGDETIVVTTFSNADSMGIQTVCYEVDSVDTYIVPTPFAFDYALVSVDGLFLVPRHQYSITEQEFDFGAIYFTGSILQFGAIPQSGWIVATAFTANAARGAMHWLHSTLTPSCVRMVPLTDTSEGGWDSDGFESQRWDGDIVGESVQRYSLDKRFESIRMTPYTAGVLVNNVAPDATEIVIDLFLQPLSEKLRDEHPLPVPDPARNRPGAIIIGHERIEYFGHERDDDRVTLSVLRRGTRGTALGQKRLVITATGDGSEHTYSFAHTGAVDVTVDGVALADDAFETSGGDVTLTASSGAYIVIGMTLAASHVSGTAVYHAQQTFLDPVPIGEAVGNCELSPMNKIIVG